MKHAGDIMIKKFKVIKASDSIQAACRIITRNKISGAPVVDKLNNLVGFISEKDIIKVLGRSGSIKKKTSQIMTKKVISVDLKVALYRLTRIFSTRPIKRIPVTKRGKVVGVIDRADVMDNLLSEHY